MTNPHRPPFYATAAVAAACVISLVLWLPAVRDFDERARKWLADAGAGHERRERVVPPTLPPTTIPPRRQADDAAHVRRLVELGLADVAAAFRMVVQWERQVEPLLRNDEGRLISTHPELTQAFAIAYRRLRPARAKLEALGGEARRSFGRRHPKT